MKSIILKCKQVMHIIKPNLYLSLLDIKDAFYIFRIYEQHRKCLKFMWVDKAYQFIVMPNGNVDAMRVFNKILKPSFCWLRKQGFASVVYVDDTLLVGETYQEYCYICNYVYVTKRWVHYSTNKIIICTITRNNFFSFRN